MTTVCFYFQSKLIFSIKCSNDTKHVYYLFTFIKLNGEWSHSHISVIFIVNGTLWALKKKINTSIVHSL